VLRLEELRAELALELAHDLADPGLRDLQAIGRTTEVQLLAEREEEADLAQLDVLPHRPAGLIAASRRSRLL
jgi:hypothetical protein